MISSISSSCSFIIRSTIYDVEYLTNLLNIIPSKTIKKGKFIHKFVGESEFNIWCYELLSADNENPNENMRRFLQKLKPLKNQIDSISTEATFRVFVQSELAQIILLPRGETGSGKK